jgi:hypothetical protein
VDVTVGGQFLPLTYGVYISGTGVHGALLSFYRPLTGTEALDIADKLTAARTKLAAAGADPGPIRPENAAGLAKIAQAAGVTDSELRSFIEFQRTRLDTKRQLNPQLAQNVVVRVTVDANAPPGVRLLRLASYAGLTNPVRFVVGTLPEMVETKPNPTVPPVIDQLPVVVNGQVLPGDVDRYTFHGRKGMSLVAACDARELMPYVADTVPGWFQAAIELYDSHGHELAYADHFLFHHDPAFHVRLPADGDYTIAVHDAIYRGREDFVYRLSLGEIPYVESIYPLGGTVGKATAVALTGWNLPKSTAVVPAATSPGTRLVSLGGPELGSPTVEFNDSEFLEVAAKPAVGSKAALAQQVSLPVMVNGKIDVPGHAGVFKFSGRAGETVVAETMARRLGSPLDSVITLTSPSGKVLAVNDDYKDKGFGLVTDQADSYVTATLPAAGTYVVTVSDAAGKGGPDYGYRLRLSEPQPGFDLRVEPSTISVRRGGVATFTVTALRRDGFNDAISLALKNAPAGCVITGGSIAAKSDTATVTLKMPVIVPADPMVLSLEGSATVGGRTVQAEAVPADDMMQAFAYRHLVAADEWLIALFRPRTVAPMSPAAATATLRKAPAAAKPQATLPKT